MALFNKKNKFELILTRTGYLIEKQLIMLISKAISNLLFRLKNWNYPA